MKIALAIFSCLFFTYSFSQVTTPPVTTQPVTSQPATAKTKKVNLLNRPNDHLLIQLSSDHWTSMPDSIKSHQSGLSRGLNVYFMFDKPLKSTPKLSVGFGLGVSTSNIIFKRVNIDLSSTGPTLPFTSLDSTSHFKRYKLSTGYLEIPVELRYSSKPDNPNKTFKAAIGAKLGTMINAHTKGKILVDKNGNVLDSYTMKEAGKRYINGTRLMATGRIGYGIFSLFGAFQVNGVLKSAAGPLMHLYQVGITVSGL